VVESALGILFPEGKKLAGSKVQVPVLVVVAERSSAPTEWGKGNLVTDVLCNTEGIKQVIGQLGKSVALEVIPNAMHEILHSQAEAREEAYKRIFRYFRWLIDPDAPTPSIMSESEVAKRV